MKRLTYARIQLFRSVVERSIVRRWPFRGDLLHLTDFGSQMSNPHYSSPEVPLVFRFHVTTFTGAYRESFHIPISRDIFEGLESVWDVTQDLERALDTYVANFQPIEPAVVPVDNGSLTSIKIRGTKYPLGQPPLKRAPKSRWERLLGPDLLGDLA